MQGKKIIKQIYLNGGWVRYELTRKNIKRLNLRVNVDGQLKVSAPSRMPLVSIENFLRTNAQFIERSQAKMAERISVVGDFVQMGQVYLLGEVWPLQIKKAAVDQIRAEKGQLWLYVKKTDKAYAARVLQKWLDAQAESMIDEAFARIYPQFARAGVKRPQYELRHMTARWGSCAAGKNKLLFNKKLVHLPPECVEYVVAHELTHLLVPNHSREFYRRLEEFRPSWREEEKKLARFVCREKTIDHSPMITENVNVIDN